MAKLKADSFQFAQLDKSIGWKLSNQILALIRSKENGLTFGQAKELLAYTSDRLEDATLSELRI